MKSVIRSALAAALSLSFTKNILQSMIRWDFKDGSARDNLMQLCFSSLASWFVLLLMLIISVLPYDLLPVQYSDSMSTNSLLLFLTDGHLGPMLTVLAVTFLLTWLFRQEILTILIIALLVKASWLHINSATAGLLAVLLSSLCYRWWAVLDIKSEARRVWNVLHQLQMVSFLITFSTGLYYLDFLQLSGLFGEQGLSRVHFLAAIVVLYYALNFLLMSLFGHFYFHRKTEPQDLPVYFSTSNWILRFQFNRDFRDLLRKKAEVEIGKHQKHLKDFNELKTSSPGLASLPLEKVLTSEIDFLKEAILRIGRA